MPRDLRGKFGQQLGTIVGRRGSASTWRVSSSVNSLSRDVPALGVHVGESVCREVAPQCAEQEHTAGLIDFAQEVGHLRRGPLTHQVAQTRPVTFLDQLLHFAVRSSRTSMVAVSHGQCSGTALSMSYHTKMADVNLRR